MIAASGMMTDVEAAKYLLCEPETVQRAAIDGKLPGVKFGRAWLFPRSALEEALHLIAMANLRGVQLQTPAAHAVQPAAPRGRRRSGPPPALPAI